MPRYRVSATAAVACAIVLAVGACQSAPPAPTLTDPKEILAAAVTTTMAAGSVRVDGSADGTIGLELSGFETPSSVELSGTTFSADLDLANGNVRVTFSAPGLLGLTGEVIVLEGTTYLKTSLTGSLYHVQTSAPVDVPASSDDAARATILKDLADLLANPALEPVKGEDVQCGSTSCYRVEIVLSPADLAALGAGDLQAPDVLPIPIPIPDLSAATVDLTVLVTKDTTHLAGLTAKVDLGADGAAAADLTFSKWDEPVSIAAPPPDQLAPTS